MVTRASGRRELRAAFTGAAAHAGAAPELGVSAIAMAAHAIARMPLGRMATSDTVAHRDHCGVASGQHEDSRRIARRTADNMSVEFRREARSLSEHGLRPADQRHGHHPPPDGMRPEVRDGAVYSDGSSVLGADDKAGLAAIVEAMRAVGEAGHAHGPVELVFTVGEEVGHVGSRAFDLTGVQSRRAFVLDSTAPVGGIVTRASGRRELRAAFTGAAAHAGAAPELGVSAIAMAAHAIARMPLGRIDADTVANIGTIAGGQADNIVAPEARITGEARSLSEHGLDRQIDAMTAAMDATAAEFGGSVDYQVESFVRAYALEGADPVVHLAGPRFEPPASSPPTSRGGASDAHQFIANGLPSACLGAGYVNVHSDDEYMPLDALGSLAAVTIQLILNA